jgi:acyl-coenzyme A thioesterase PaaI-like protein
MPKTLDELWEATPEVRGLLDRKAIVTNMPTFYVEVDSEKQFKGYFQVKPEHGSGIGYMHSMIYTGIADSVTLALMVRNKKFGPAMDIHVSYFVPAKIGEKIVVEATLLKSTKSFMFSRVDFFSENGKKLIATANVTKGIPASPKL